ncbi:Crp/Fnr family transcriptional regulator [Brevibacillus daliensis]|uniref:Crp/Fnr family transcriptional regulator n=1 Tax=Brevibacillus daliensis TaxID=2892995 RepID=UPI001E5B5613|nr:Crp/Fnr family transcriptional regulator [Brevibacillus daliensis]
MEEYFSLFHKIPLFKGFKESEMESVLSCLHARKRSYQKNEIILLAGEAVTHIGIVLSGKVQIFREDIKGNGTIMTSLEAGSLFAETFAFANIRTIPVTVSAATESVILFIDFSRIVSNCSNACVFHVQLIQNMLSILAQKNIMLNQKIEHLSKRSTRDKLLSYLSEQAVLHRTSEFVIPYNRQELANYLCVDRSAMSNELCKLRDEGILSFNKNLFRLL